MNIIGFMNITIMQKENTKSKKKSKTQKLTLEYNASNEIFKEIIKSEENKTIRFFKRLVYLCISPFLRLFFNIRDVRVLFIFLVVFLALSSEVRVPYMLGFMFMGTKFGAVMFSVGSACWLWWLGPFTPFLPICISLTMTIKAIIDKIMLKKLSRRSE